MMISTRGRYALRTLLDIAEHQGSGYVSLKDSAERQEISKKYLEQIVPILTHGNIVKTNRGYNGGYKLALSPDRCTVGQVLRLTEGSLTSTSQDDDDTTRYIWQGLDEVVNNYFDSISIQDIIDSELQSFDYVI